MMNTALKLLRFLPAVAFLFVWGCEMEENTLQYIQKEVDTYVLVMDHNARRTVLEEMPGKLIAGQNLEAGEVTVAINDQGNIVVTVNANADWCLSELHVHAADEPGSFR